LLYLSSVVPQGGMQEDALCAMRVSVSAMLYAPCSMRSFVCMANFFMNDTELFLKFSQYRITDAWPQAPFLFNLLKLVSV